MSLYTVSSTITTTTALGIGPSVRFIIIEEVENKCVKSISGIKRLCDGKLEFRAKGGSDMVEYCINGKTIVTSNELIANEVLLGIPALIEELCIVTTAAGLLIFTLFKLSTN